MGPPRGTLIGPPLVENFGDWPYSLQPLLHTSEARKGTVFSFMGSISELYEFSNSTFRCILQKNACLLDFVTIRLVEYILRNEDIPVGNTWKSQLVGWQFLYG